MASKIIFKLKTVEISCVVSACVVNAENVLCPWALVN